MVYVKYFEVVTKNKLLIKPKALKNYKEIEYWIFLGPLFSRDGGCHTRIENGENGDG